MTTTGDGKNDAMANPSSPLHVLLAGGGTGGHVFPALAMAEELAARGWRVSFTGSETGIEARLVAARGIPFHPLPARPLVGRGLVAKVQSLATVTRSAFAASRLIRRLGAGAVLGTGGYVSAPAVLGARLARRPVLLLEPNAHAGVANRWLSRFASGAAVGYQETIQELKCPCWVTGIPVRSAFFSVPEPESTGAEPRLLVLGGSQGAQQINQAMPAVAARLLVKLPALRILHQAGARNLEETRQAYAAAGLLGDDSLGSRSSTTSPGRWRRASSWSPGPAPSRWRRSAPRGALPCCCRSPSRRGIRWATRSSSPRPAPPRSFRRRI
jgi:UDP-N-acetylglucosamine--N-acetylmuramyl-(pentapeptide) pyrophosphoryl-undecaprenol N-acetylglucosamine transferase